ncbi:protein asteroid homolog 1-like isoform X1 [Esox lucius]|uniref:protein asteroid homolog 1-like isoform X1 n=1 Tax=Esox lucius TaxID=8010 RepID=UPI001476B27A|nr:protein asteroid homolog 1-like isoform X1 [Esox lucius]
MGVPGLNGFIEDNRKCFKEVQFKNSKLIIDGSNLYHSLYLNSHLDQSRGGDYDAYGDLICAFFKVLRECGIEPYVIIDGGSDYTDNKFETLQKRAQSKIDKAHGLSVGLQGSNVIPTISKTVFKQVLSSLNVSFAQCLCEADQEIASLAETWKCPVLSNDSDFFVFDIQGGYLPMTHFKWQELSVDRGGSQKSIPCKHYTTTMFCSEFSINRQLLPIFAALAGNDYVNLQDMGFNFRWKDSSTMGYNRKKRFVFFFRLLNWLKHFQTAQEALKSVPELIGHGNNQRQMATALQAISLGMEEYTLTPGTLERLFNHGVAPDRRVLPKPLRVLPDWTMQPLVNGRLPTKMVDVMLQKKAIQIAQVENPSLPSGNITSRPIRQVLYGLLLGRGAVVEEYDRERQILTGSLVKAVLPRAAGQLRLETLDQAPGPVRLQVFSEALEVSQSTWSGVPPHLGLPVAVTCYWLRCAQPRPDKPLLQALLLGLVYGELCRRSKSQGAEEGPVLRGLRGRIQPGARGLDLGVAHTFSQWQSCLRESLDLNQLLCFPLPEPQCVWLYRGTLVHQLVAKLRAEVTPDSLLMEDSSSVELYRTMLDAVLNSEDLRSNLMAPLQKLELYGDVDDEDE